MRIIGWRYICLRRNPITRQCTWWIRIPIFVFDRIIVELPPRPDPPWLGGEGIGPELSHDLQVLATIDVLAQTMSEGRKQAALDWVQAQFEGLKLPEGMEVVSERDVQRGK